MGATSDVVNLRTVLAFKGIKIVRADVRIANDTADVVRAASIGLRTIEAIAGNYAELVTHGGAGTVTSLGIVVHPQRTLFTVDSGNAVADTVTVGIFAVGT